MVQVHLGPRDSPAGQGLSDRYEGASARCDGGCCRRCGALTGAPRSARSVARGDRAGTGGAPRCTTGTPLGDVAQLAEHCLCKAGVRGSIPLVSTTGSFVRPAGLPPKLPKGVLSASPEAPFGQGRRRPRHAAYRTTSTSSTLGGAGAIGGVTGRRAATTAAPPPTTRAATTNGHRRRRLGSIRRASSRRSSATVGTATSLRAALAASSCFAARLAVRARAVTMLMRAAPTPAAAPLRPSRIAARRAARSPVPMARPAPSPTAESTVTSFITHSFAQTLLSSCYTASAREARGWQDG